MTNCQMLRGILASAVIGLVAVSAPQAVYTPGSSYPKNEIVPGRVIVQFHDNVDVNRAMQSAKGTSFGLPSFEASLTSLGVTGGEPLFKAAVSAAPMQTGGKVGRQALTRFYRFFIPETADVLATVAALKQNPAVRTAEPVYVRYQDAAPNDPQWPSQWHMEPPGPDPNVYTAWDKETGSDAIIIAIVDGGVNHGHPDLAANIWVNPEEDLDGDGAPYDTDDLNGIDEDGNGYVDDLVGYDFVSYIPGGTFPGEDGNTPDPNPNDFGGHGTHVAGITAACINNATNVTGMAGGWYGGHWSRRGARIMACRAGGVRPDGLGTLGSDIVAEAITYAVDNGADVINASFGGGAFNAPEAAAMDYAIANEVGYVHSAGNDNTNVPGWEDIRPGITTVASTTSSDGKSSFSNYGSWIDVSAPGSGILSTYSSAYTPTTTSLQGTSMAAPCVAGLYALVKSMAPHLTRDSIEAIIINTADSLAVFPGEMGSGRINANTAMNAMAYARFTSDIYTANVPFTVNFTDQSSNSPTSWDWNFGDGNNSTVQNPSHLYGTPGVYNVSLTVQEPLGQGTENLQRYIWARADTMVIDSVLVERNTKVVVPVRLTNTAHIKEFQFNLSMTNNAGVFFDSFSVVGTRTADWESMSLNSLDATNKRYGVKLISNLAEGSSYVEPGTGVLLNIHVRISGSATRGAVIPLDSITLGSKVPYMGTVFENYFPVFKAGKIVVKNCAHGDANCSGGVDIGDLQMLVDYLFLSGPAPDPSGGNVDGVGLIDISDLQYIVDYLFFSGPPPPQ